MKKYFLVWGVHSTINGIVHDYEVHHYEYDNDGRRWEKTSAGPFIKREYAQQWIDAAEQSNQAQITDAI